MSSYQYIFFTGIFVILALTLKTGPLKSNPSNFNNSSSSVESTTRWDTEKVFNDCESCHEQLVSSFLNRVNNTSKPCFAWLLDEPPEFLTLLTVLFQDESDSDTPIIKFIGGAGYEIMLTEAAYRGYTPAMSILASHYENEERFSEAEYWRKVGVASLNPTSILLRGLKYSIDGSLQNNEELSEKGSKLIVLSYSLGELLAIKVPGFDSLASVDLPKSILEMDDEDVIDYILETEGFNKGNLLTLLDKFQFIRESKEVSVSEMIRCLSEMNDILDSPTVTVGEIHYLLPIRNTLASDILSALAGDSNHQAYKSFMKAELVWKFQRTKGAPVFLTEAIIPMIL